jgi:hypothetical protein
MIYKILAILAIIGMAGAAVLPSDLIEHRPPGQTVVLSGVDPAIFQNPMMKLPSLGTPPHGWASDLGVSPAFTLQPLIYWARKEPVELESI